MAKAQVDFRLAISEGASLAIKATAQARGVQEQQVAREIIEEWHRRKHREHMLYAKALRSNGLQMALDGLETEDDGEPRSARR